MRRALLLVVFPILALAVGQPMPSIRIEPVPGGSLVIVHNPTSPPLIAVFLALAAIRFGRKSSGSPFSPEAIYGLIFRTREMSPYRGSLCGWNVGRR